MNFIQLQNTTTIFSPAWRTEQLGGKIQCQLLNDFVSLAVKKFSLLLSLWLYILAFSNTAGCEQTLHNTK